MLKCGGAGAKYILNNERGVCTSSTGLMLKNADPNTRENPGKGCNAACGRTLPPWP